MKEQGKKISIITCYDYWSAKIISASCIDAVLVGDSAAMTMHGFETTINAEIDMICYHVSAVKRGIAGKFLIADLPFLDQRKGSESFYKSVDRLMKCGAQAIKIEGASGNLSIIKELVHTGVPVMGHLGLTPQSVHQFGGFRMQGTDGISSENIFNDAIALQEAGCFALVLEMIPSRLSKRITDELAIPTIGIGAGPGTDGQVLVFQDLLGLDKDFSPKFARKYMNGYEQILNALNGFSSDVKDLKFPSNEESN
jgi:3-methyl-2-oxobutanoate hydroxymethyltransferase